MPADILLASMRLLPSKLMGWLKTCAPRNIESIRRTLPVLKLTGWLKLNVSENINCIAVALLV